jgi:TM2 domain-containing membrane protein YozV
METVLPESEGQPASDPEEQANQPSINSSEEPAFPLESQPQPAASTIQESHHTKVEVCPYCQKEHPVGTQYCPVTGKPLAPAASTGNRPGGGFNPQSSQNYPPQQPQYPYASQQPYYPPPYPAYPTTRSPKDRNTALVLEILPGLFGILGIGWIYSGKTGTGIAWLIGYLIWVGIVITAAVLTGFMACFCTVPINLICVGISASTLNTYTKSNPHLFGP